jgi:hypothetical protein
MKLLLLLAPAIVLLATSPGFAQTFTNPARYCKAVGTIDKPDSRYIGPKLPDWMAADLNLKPDQGSLMEWRCANGVVLACVYGANIPCGSKANISQKPTTAMSDYCQQNPGSTFIPMVVTGHETANTWACRDKVPIVTKSAEVDTQGFQKSYWKAVSP